MNKGFSKLLIAFIVLAVSAGGWFVYTNYLRPKPRPVSGEIRDVSSEDLKTILGQGKPGIVEFYTNGCYYCAMIAPELRKVEIEYGDRLFVVKINAERYPAEAAKYELRGVPTMVFFDASGKPVVTVVGYRNYEGLLSVLKGLKFVP